MKNKAESGIALATTLIVLFLVVALVVGFSWMVLVDQKLGGVNGDQQYAFYGAEAGLEKLTSNLGFLFSTNPAPSTAQVNALDTAAMTPAVPGIQYVRPDGTLGYQIDFPIDPVTGNPLAQTHTILSGPYQGMTGLLTPFTLTATARNVASGAEVKLQRNVQTVAIPVFQFGMFSQTDLSFYPGPYFNFGGRVHTNGNLFLAGGSDLVFGDKVTAAGDIVRQQLSNGWATSSGYTGNVYVPTTAGGCPAPPTVPGGTTASCWQLQRNEGSVVAGAGSAATLNWPAITARYHGYLQSKVKPLNLGITLSANTFPIDLIRRALPGEDASNPTTLAQRYYSEASVRILLSDNPLDITGLPCEDKSVPPTNLALETPAQLNNVPIAASGANNGNPLITTYNAYKSSAPRDGYWQPAGNPLVTGYIKIEIETSYAVPPAPCGVWKDVTAQVLGFGIAGKNLNPSNGYSTYGATYLPPLPGVQLSGEAAIPCAEPSPNAIIRLERVRDNPGTVNTGGTHCGFQKTGPPSTTPSDYWPNALFDTREGNLRDYTPGNAPWTVSNVTINTISYPYSSMPTPGGVMDYTELDIGNLANYLRTNATGQLAKDLTNSSYDFVVYFSDRRGNYTPGPVAGGWPAASPSNNETGEYGFEDSINPPDQFGCPNDVLDQGEQFDVAENPGSQTPGASAPESYGEQSPMWKNVGNNTPSPVNDIDPITGKNVFPTLFSNLLTATTPAIIQNPNPNCNVVTMPWPHAYIVHPQEARENAPIFFRRALKIVDGNSINLGTCPDGVQCGLTVVSENPVYIQGEFNALNGAANGVNSFTGPHVATSVVADAVTLLSDNWNDVNSFSSPYTLNLRNAVTTAFRFGVVAGKGISFPYPGYGSYQDFGTDGGVHNFLRFLENWGSPVNGTLWYRGSVVSFYYSRQATGVYKDGFNNTVYSPPGRGYNFDSEFLTPSKLPPRTPLFRDVNTIGFTQTVLPTN